MRDRCPICLKPTPVTLLADTTKCNVSCKVCGDYWISMQAAAAAASGNLVLDEKRHILSGAIRNLSEQGVKVEILKPENIETIKASVSVPSDPFERIDLLLKYLLRKTGETGEFEKLDAHTLYPILFAKTPSQFSYYVQKAHELGYIERDSGSTNVDRHRLALGGWRRLTELRKYERKSDQAFVAMWFDDSLNEVWKSGFYPALKQAGYNPIRIDWVEHNEKICDMIVATIRKSGLLVADVTGHRESVYFEVGFAMGLGMPVIWTCRNDYIKNLPFDTRQYNHIVWSDSEDLKEKLINRIEATLPIRPRKRL